MSSILDLIPIGAKHDGRRKISGSQKREVSRLYEIDQMSINGIAREVGISKRSVQFILFPERLKVVQDRAKEVKRWSKYNEAEYHTPYMQKHRAKKKKLIEEGKLVITNQAMKDYKEKLDNRKK